MNEAEDLEPEAGTEVTTSAKSVVPLTAHGEVLAIMPRNIEEAARYAQGLCVSGIVPDAFREVLRYDMPTQFLMRVLKKDVTLHGVTMRQGRPVMFLYPSANRDRREFENPDSFNIAR